MREKGIEPAPKVNKEAISKLDQMLEKRLEQRFGGKLVVNQGVKNG
jgi:hypothetical protein